MRSVFVCLVLFLVICLCGCSYGSKGYFSFRERGFCAEVRGELHGEPFAAEVSVKPSGDTYLVQVCYLSPETLESLRVTATCERGGAVRGEGCLLWEAHESRLDAASLTGLLLPVTVLLTDAEVATVRYEGDTCYLTLVDGVSLTLGEDGLPRSLRAEEISFEVVWLEWSDMTDLV